MPLPRPNQGEAQGDFTARCMGSEAIQEFDSQDQRVAVCMSQWRHRNEKGAPGAPDHETKSFQGMVTKVADEAQGIVESIVAVFGNIDSGDDIIEPGAFTKTLQEQGRRVRVLDQHKTDSGLRVIGKPLDMREVRRAELPAEVLRAYPDATGGLWARTQFAMGTPEGKGIFERLKEGMLSEWSIGYDPVKAGREMIKRGGENRYVRRLKEIGLREYSPVIFGMNAATTTLSAKDEAGTMLVDPSKAEDMLSCKAEGCGKPAMKTGYCAYHQDAAKQPKEMTEGGPRQRLGDVLQGTIHRAFTMLADEWYIAGLLNRDERIAISGAIGDALDSLNEAIPEDVANRVCYHGASPAFMAALAPASQASDPTRVTLTAPAASANADPAAAEPDAHKGVADEQLLAQIDLYLAEMTQLELSEA